jgi:integrase
MSVHRIVRRDGTVAWKTRWREGAANRGRSFDLKRDAIAWDREASRRRQLGPIAAAQLVERRGPTLGWWIEHRWAPEHASTLAASTRERYANVYSVHISPTLDAVPLSEIGVSRLRAWQVERIKAGTQPGTLDKCRTLLSSILRHAAEAEAIPANPMGLVRPPAAEQRDSVVPLAPSTVEAIRRAMLDPAPTEVAANGRRSGYSLPAVGTPGTRSRDALIVSVLAYSGLRPGELRGIRWSDIGEGTILVQRATNPDGSIKVLKAGQRRSVKLLTPLAQDLREYRLVAGRPAASALILPDEHGQPWSKSMWQMWRVDRWAPACRAAGLSPLPRPYDCRHSFASLLLAEGRQPTYVSRQLGHSIAVLFSTYGHLLSEFEDRERIDAEAEIREARSLSVPRKAAG